MEKRNVIGFLERADLDGEGGLAHPFGSRRGGKSALAGDGMECLQLSMVHDIVI
jgi:hypothetical protein